MPGSPLTIAVTFDRDRPASRGMLQGIARVAKAEHWRLLVTRNEVSREVDGPFDGMIGWVSPAELDLAKALGCPFVCISQQGPGLGLPSVLPNNRAIGELVAEALIERGFRHLASFLTRDPVMHNALARDAAFERAAREAGCTFTRFTSGPRTVTRWNLTDQLADLRDWLKQVERPVGVLASDDEHGWRLLVAAREAGLSVPAEVAVVGVENDPAFCDFSDPPLASVNVNQPAIGEAAADLMRRLLAGETPPPTRLPVLVPPVGLVWRTSCDVQIVDDAQMTRMLTYIREQLEFGVRAADVAEAFGLSIRTLDRHMHDALGKSPGEVIRDARHERAMRLIITTRKPLVEVAVACGFGHLSQLSRAIKRETGQTPTQHRARKTGGDSENLG